MKTYIIIMQKTNEGNLYCKVGKTTNIDRRVKNYVLHNPGITDILIHDDDIENEILSAYWFNRVINMYGKETEWLDLSGDITGFPQIDDEYIAESFIDLYGFKPYYRCYKWGENYDTRMEQYKERNL